MARKSNKKRNQQRRIAKREKAWKGFRDDDERIQWFVDSVKSCKQRFKALCDSGTAFDAVNEERDQLVRSVDVLARIWAIEKWRDVRRDLFEPYVGHRNINNAIADQIDEQFPDLKRIQMKKIKIEFKRKHQLPFTEEECINLLTGDFGCAQAVKNLCNQLGKSAEEIMRDNEEFFSKRASATVSQ